MVLQQYRSQQYLDILLQLIAQVVGGHVSLVLIPVARLLQQAVQGGVHAAAAAAASRQPRHVRLRRDQTDSLFVWYQVQVLVLLLLVRKRLLHHPNKNSSNDPTSPLSLSLCQCRYD